MGRNFDPIDIIFIVLIGTYLLTLFAIILILVYGKKADKPVRYKVIEVISPRKGKKRKKAKQTKDTTKNTVKKKSNNNQNNKKKKTTTNNVRYKGKAPTKKKTGPRKKKGKTNGVNKKRKK